MPDPIDPKDPKDPANPAPKQDDPKKPDEPKVITIPQDKWDEMYKRNKDLEREKAEAEAAAKAKAEADAAEQGKWKELADQRAKDLEIEKAKSAELEGYKTESEKVFETMLASELEKIPDDRKSLIPETFTTRQKLDYINKNRAVLGSTGVSADGKPLPKQDKPAPGDELARLESEREELMKKRRENGFFKPTETTRLNEISRKIEELKSNK